MAKTSTSSSSDPLIQALTSRIMAESRAASNALADPYDPQYSINHWLDQYEDSCDSQYMSDEQKRQHVGAYLPKDAARWIRQSKTSSWADVKKKLLKTFGIAPKEYKQLALKRLKSLRQGKTPIAQYALRFEFALLEFLDGQAPDDDATLLIFFNSLNESTRLSVRPNICLLATWEDVSDAAIAIENAVPSDDSLLEREFAKLSLEAAPSPSPSFGSSVSDPSPMEIDTFQRNRGNCSHSRFSSVSGISGAPHSQPRGNHPMCQWTKDGRPICGHCSTVGHLSKKCRARNGKPINQVGTVPIDDSTDSAPTVNMVQASTTPVQYAAIPIDDDPLAEPTGPMVNNVALVTSPAQGVSMVHDNVSTPRVKITLQGHLVQALVDTGTNISAIRTSIANKLGVSPNVTKAAQFKIANNDNATSRGTVAIPTMIGAINTVLTYHVVDNLSYPAIVGYPQLKRLGAVIHTDTNVIRFPTESSPGFSGLSGRVHRASSRGSSGSVSLVCTVASHLRLPGQHHAFVDILGPPNSSVFVSTPSELAAEKLLTVASGIVDFDKNGIATVKLANLDNKLKYINKGQQIATCQYLSPSLKVYSLSPDLTVNNVETTTTSCPVDFSPYIGQHLSHSEQTAMQELLQF
ncbi:hypothetical protein G6F57_013243 [Rhizopus arrhizus]|nr:hypothetical protein G6F24_010769 [Rhizopus arrhizus]KAG0847832.1 hypothetical protein G6F17_012179 [Rhizopus arrhizus]KAG0931865.1 hypothetical protein G6F30_011001 [Rhizopus arrhizus]KAG0975932.1 hypothetical protein G6F29_011167 [Rhizopus arrhizus]KAG1003209.1 hypothetical protein G6F27_011260 [Rhizopus arrhizus]